MSSPAANALFASERPPTGRALTFGMIVTVLLFGGFITWATMAPLAEAALAPGQIRVEGTRRTIQHLEGGVIREILVRDGDRVRAGQVVMRLDTIQAESAREALRASRAALTAQAARLAAEAEEAPHITFPDWLRASEDPRAREAITGQSALFQARRASLESQLAMAQAREMQGRSSMEAAQGQLRAARRQLELVVQEEAMRRGLVNQGLSRLTELLAVQRALAGIEGTIEDLTAQIQRAGALVAEAQSLARSTRSTRMQEVEAEAREVAARLAEVEERLRAADDIAVRREILAPEAGTIVNLRVFTVGGVVRPGDPLMDLVPEQDALVAEVQIQPLDIDMVHMGMRADVRLSAFRQGVVPALEGHVTFVAADATQDPQTRMTYYRAFITLAPGQVEKLPGVFLAAGMPVEAHIVTGQRSFWRYMTQPLRESMRRAFTEN
jgi:HlyD family type I secretion membrane fusion protein